ncbi:MAG: tetratricopeptide repeat protein [bacterium]|nr:tetratricopeptide repeat protein [bacterium]
MNEYLLQTLSPGGFEELAVRICHEILGFGTISFSSGPDGGRDAFFEGTAQRYPSEVEPWAGKFVIQAKHTERADASCSDSDFTRILKTEAPKVAALRQAGRCDNYLLFTNRKLGAVIEGKLVKELRQETGVGNVAILGRETITSYLDGASEIAEAMGLQVSPFVAGLPSIPPPTRDFAGRTDELEELRKAVSEHGGAMIYGVRGLGGIGKTQLGLKLVELVGDDYPDGHILVELGGASEHPMSAADAMASVIRAYEPQAKLPEAEEDLHRLYHQALKDRRVILLLDNAASAEQVEPVLPHTGCLTLVTSRKRFALPKLHRLDLDALTPEAARELLLSLAPLLGDEAERIAELLGRLPLALRVAGGAFAEDPFLEPVQYVHKLEDRDERVTLVEAAIDFNYGALEAELKQQWRALAIFPGDFDIAGVATVWAVEADAARKVLGILYRAGLAERRGGRCRLHDLARDFAASRLRDGERRTAALRHAGHYVEVLREADRLYTEGGDSILEGLALFDLEWDNLRAGQAWARANANVDREAAEHTYLYPTAGVFCLYLRLHPADWRRWLEAAYSAAVALDDRRGEGVALGNLALTCADLGDERRAISYCKQALVIYRELGERWSEGNALNHLGLSYAHRGEEEKAIGYYKQALAVSRQLGDRLIESAALSYQGLAYDRLGEVGKAVAYYEGALVISRELGDRRGEAAHLGNLGSAYLQLGDVDKGIDLCEQALVILRGLEDRRSEGAAVGTLGRAYAQIGKVDKAIKYFRQALDVHREVGDVRSEGTALDNLGRAYVDLGEVDEALSCFEQQLAISQDIGDKRGEGIALGNLGLAYKNRGETRRAIGYLKQQLAIVCEIGNRRAEASARGNLGLAYADLGKMDEAIALLEQALEVGQAIKSPEIIQITLGHLERLRDPEIQPSLDER